MSLQNDTPEKRKRARWERAFFASLRRLGNVSRACKAAKIERMTAYRNKERHADFAAEWADAMDEAMDRLEHEAYRRAVKGLVRMKFSRSGQPLIDPRTQEPYFERVYSDTLMIVLLKGGRPEKYKDRHEHAGPGGGNIPVQHGGKVEHEHSLDPAALAAFARDLALSGLGDLPPDGQPKPVDQERADPPPGR